MTVGVNIPCYINGAKTNFLVYVGKPADGNSPITNQLKWLESTKHAVVPDGIIDAFNKLHKISKDQNLELEKLCEYAFNEAQKDKSQVTTEDNVNDLSNDNSLDGNVSK